MDDLPEWVTAHPSPAVRLMLLARQSEAWSPERAAKHKRDGKGRFAKGSGAAAALDAGDEEALNGMSREHLRREARKRGITLKRGAPLDEIKDALWDHHGGQKGEAAEPAAIPGTRTPEQNRDTARAAAERLAVSGHTPGWVALADLRDAMPDLTRAEQDEAIRMLNRLDGFNVQGLANYKSLTPRDRAAAFDLGEEPMHMIRVASIAKAPSVAPTAMPLPSPEPAKTMTPEATLSAAPKALDADSGRGLSRSQTAALERYRSSDFTEINAHLRGQADGKRPAWVDKTVAEMDAAHADSKLTEGVVVHRGIGNVNKVFGAAAKKNLTGAEWTDEAPQSTTADPDIADRFQRSEGDGRRTDARLIVRVPAGTGAIQLSDGQYEAEMLLERGLRMRVVSDTGPWRRGQKKPRTIEVEVVPV